MEIKVDMHINFERQVFPLGTLWLRSSFGKESASFEYSDAWLKYPGNFSMDPSTPLTRGSFHTGSGRQIFAFLTDCMPDRWGRTILRRREKRRPKGIGETPRTLTEADFLFAVNDLVRQGALQFTGSHLHTSEKQVIPSILFLSRLLSASTKLQNDMESDEDIRLLLAPGSSLGGARPKAAVLDAKGKLWIAKFPSTQDQWDVPLWEFVSLKLANEAGLKTPLFRLKKVGGKNVLLVLRFDRDGTTRIPFASAMTLLDLRDGDPGSYLEIAEIIRLDGSKPLDDIKELWRRMVFNAMISNVDDHLRNHAFLRELSGWRLSPVYDIESTPPEYRPPYQHTPLFPQNSLHLDMVLDEALSASEEFGFHLNEARTAIQRLSRAIGQWSSTAKTVNANKAEMEIMESAFRIRIPADTVKKYFC
jgi:serine/threonine-protein kinase HipA